MRPPAYFDRSQPARTSIAARPSRTEGSSFSSRSFSPPAFLTVIRGDVPIPSIWPRASTSQGGPCGRRNTQNFRLDEPAFRTRAYASTTPPSRPGPPGVGDQNGDGATGDPGPDAVRPAGEDDGDPRPQHQAG